MHSVYLVVSRRGRGVRGSMADADCGAGGILLLRTMSGYNVRASLNACALYGGSVRDLTLSV